MVCRTRACTFISTEYEMESDDGRFINSVISLNPAIERARQLDEIQLQSGTNKNSVFGIPVLLKDNIGFAGIPTTAGAAALIENHTTNAFIMTDF